VQVVFGAAYERPLVLIPVGVAELFGRDKIPDVDGPSKRAIAPQIVRTQEFYDRMPSLLAGMAVQISIDVYSYAP
jgi:hypothetical protein